uniref:Uncharacterized protein n=1 Tax=Anguilla anguilla TaxID=7936 RepID=A0A0E9TMY8_ANGAN
MVMYAHICLAKPAKE